MCVNLHTIRLSVQSVDIAQNEKRPMADFIPGDDLEDVTNED